jgi:hypothetical protein
MAGGTCNELDGPTILRGTIGPLNIQLRLDQTRLAPGSGHHITDTDSVMRVTAAAASTQYFGVAQGRTPVLPPYMVTGDRGQPFSSGGPP